MQISTLLIGIVSGAVIAAVIVTLWYRTSTVARRDFETLKDEFQGKDKQLAVMTQRLADREGELGRMEAELREMDDQLAALTRENSRLDEKVRAFDELKEKSLNEFKVIANELLEAKSAKFTESNQKNIQTLLEPLGKEINAFRTKVEEVYDKESKERFSLRNEVGRLIEQTGKVSEEANNLAAALKGQTKKQGDWGEVILERVLEKAGFERGREFELQENIKNEEGDNQRPDVVIHLPENRCLIVDSKVALVAYDRFCCAETDEEREIHLKDHLGAIATHIDQLSARKYEEMEASLDFVLMFVPVEPAYLVALSHDPSLWDRAYSKRIILISPTNLLAAVKLVSDLWKRENQSKNALEIARQGERLYNKFVGFLTNMDEVGRHILKTQEAYNKALGQLKQGPGNLVHAAEKLRDLGLKPQKQLPASMLNYDEEPEISDVGLRIAE